MKFYKVEQQSFVYKEARYKRNDKFKLNLTPSIYNKCRNLLFTASIRSGRGKKAWLITPVVSTAVNVRVDKK